MEFSTREDSYRETKRKAGSFYFKMGHISSPASGGKVVFNNIGFRHLIWKGGKHRPKGEQKRRFALLPYVEKIISNPGASVFYRSKQYGYSHLKFGIFKEEVNRSIVTVVIRRVGNGQWHFFSVY
jgi:hypothetical protein